MELRSWLGWELGFCLGPRIKAHGRLATALSYFIQRQPWVLKLTKSQLPESGVCAGARE